LVRARGPLADVARHSMTLRGAQLGEVLAERVARLNAKQGVFAIPSLWLYEGQLKSARFIDVGRPSIEIQAQLQAKLPDWLRAVGLSAMARDRSNARELRQPGGK